MTSKLISEAWATISSAAVKAGYLEDWIGDERDIPWVDYIAKRIINGAKPKGGNGYAIEMRPNGDFNVINGV